MTAIFLVARIIGVGSYFIILLIFTFSFYQIKAEYRKVLLLVYLIILTVVAFMHIPPSGSDLFRLREIMHIYGNIDSLPEMLLKMSENAAPLTIPYYKLLDSLGSDRYLTAVTVFIVYANFFYAVYKATLKYAISIQGFAFIIFWSMSTAVYGATIDNIRTTLAISFITVAVCREFIEKKSFMSCTPFYLIAMLTHIFSFGAVILRIIYFAFEKSANSNKRNQKLLLLFVIVLAAMAFSQNSVILTIFIEKVNGYIYSESPYFYIWEVVVGVIEALIIVYFLYFAYKNRLFFKQEYNLINYLIILFSATVAGCVLLVLSYTFFYRMSLLVCMIAPPLAVAIISRSEIMNKELNYNLLYILSASMLFVSMLRGSLCSLKFFLS